MYFGSFRLPPGPRQAHQRIIPLPSLPPRSVPRSTISDFIKKTADQVLAPQPKLSSSPSYFLKTPPSSVTRESYCTAHDEVESSRSHPIIILDDDECAGCHEAGHILSRCRYDYRHMKKEFIPVPPNDLFLYPGPFYHFDFLKDVPTDV